MIQLQWTTQQFLAFKKEFKIASETDKDCFWFDGHEFITSYAKYLIEYLESLESQQ